MPGTVLLDERAADSEAFTHNPKHGEGRRSNIILNPQPSNDPNDPLNWPLRRRHLIFAILNIGSPPMYALLWHLFWHTFTNRAHKGPIFNVIFVEVAEEYKTTVTAVVVALGYNLLVTGCSG
jgi:hypothetical protein